MKKKIFLALAISLLLVCLFAVGVCAATPNTEGETFTLSDGTVLPIWDTDGNGLIWYKSTENTTDGYANYDYVHNNQRDTSVKPYLTISEWSDSSTKYQPSEIKITTNAGNTYSSKGTSSCIVVINMQGAKHSSGKVYTCYNSTFRENTAIEAIYFDSSTFLFAGWTCYKCANLTYVNLGDIKAQTLGGEANFAECPKLTFSLPNTLQRIERWQFQNTGITEITIPETVTYFGDTNFNNCQKLVKVYGFEEMIKRFISAAQASVAEGETATYEIPTNTFNNCKLLNMPFTNGVIPEGVTSIGSYAFDDCNGEGWETLVLPNSLTTIGQNGFQGCKGIKKAVLGANFTTFVNHDGFKNCSNLEEVYLPATLTVIPGNIFNLSANNCVFYFTGTKAQLDALKANTNGNNTAFNNAYNNSLTLEEYNAIETKNGRYIVYLYNSCDAFYNGVHIDSVKNAFPHGPMKEGVCTKGCSRDYCYNNLDTSIPAVFTATGYSHKIYGDKNAIVQTFTVNKDSLAIYNEVEEKIVGYGLVAATELGLDGSTEIFDNDGNVNTNKAGVVNISGRDESFDVFEIKVTGLQGEVVRNNETIDLAKINVFCCGYILVENGENIDSYYMSGEVVTETLSGATSYNALAGIVEEE